MDEIQYRVLAKLAKSKNGAVKKGLLNASVRHPHTVEQRESAIEALIKAGLMRVEKLSPIANGKPATIYFLTEAGKSAYEKRVDEIKAIQALIK